MQTPFTRLFGLRTPIVQAPMGGVAGSRLVSAVANAGAFGILPIWHLPVDVARALVAETRARTRRPFAVNLRADLDQHDHARAAVDAGAAAVHLFWGDPLPVARSVHQRGARLLTTVWDADSARRALDAGACAVIAQGVEAGGHVRGTRPRQALLDEVRSVVGTLPVVAAGGLATAEDVAAVLSAGADAAALGTRFAVTEESDAHPGYKQALIAAEGDATVLSTCFDGDWPDAPHRTLANSTYRAWDAAGRPRQGQRPGEGEVVLYGRGGAELPRYHMALPTREDRGDWEATALYAGCGVGSISEELPVAALIDRLISGIS